MPAHAVAAHPGPIVLAAAQGAFGDPPDIVLSGVNHGANVGRAVLHLGTVGAALTASQRRPCASSVARCRAGAAAAATLDTAVTVAATLFDRLAALPGGSVLNLNVPNQAEVNPPLRAGLAEFGTVRARVDYAGDGAISLAAIVEGELPPDSDARLLAEGHPTVTALRSVTEDPDVRL